jgi:ATP-dependent DNA ligase
MARSAERRATATLPEWRPGNRGLWLKVKCLNREEFVVVGWTNPEAPVRWLGALLLCVL